MLLHHTGDHVRRAFVPFAVVMVLAGAGCEQAEVPKPLPHAGMPLPLPPAPPRAPPRPRATAEAAPQADPAPALDHTDVYPATETVVPPPEDPPPPQVQAALPSNLALPPPAPPGLASLAGLNEGEVLNRFGRPNRAAVVGQGMRWTWNAEGCEMTMTLFPDVAAQTRRVLSAELSGASREGPGEAACLDRLGRRRAGL